MKKFLSAVLLGAAFLLPVAAQAGDSYLKFSMGQSEYKVDDYWKEKRQYLSDTDFRLIKISILNLAI